MTAYLLRRLLSSLLLVWGVLTVTFFVVHLAPGDPVDLLSGPETTAEDLARLRAAYGLDRPVAVRYVDWLGGVLRGDLGISLVRQRPVIDVLAETVPRTLQLTVGALLLHFVVGSALGLWWTRRGQRLSTRASDVGALVLYSLPTFWLGLMLQLLLSYHLRWLPSGGTPAVALDEVGFATWILEQVRHLAMPVFVLGLAGTASVARVLRNSLMLTLQEDFIRTARAKGLPPRTVFGKHAFRPASVTLVTLVGLGIPFLLSGAVATEVVFGWPGMGRVTVEALLARDTPVILATTAVSAIMVVLGNFLADLAYAWVDPRIRMDS